MKILILNGPNLNLQGRRDVAVYGSTAFEGISRGCERFSPTSDWTVSSRTSRAS